MGLTFNKIAITDLELTGLDKSIHAIHEIAAILIVDGVEVGRIHEKVRPHPFLQYDSNSLKVHGILQSEIMKYPQPDVVYRRIFTTLQEVCDISNPNDKITIVGYGSGECDQPFFREWFRRNNGSEVFKSFFHSISEDIAPLAIRYMRKHGISPKDLKLSSVAKALGIEVQTDKLHGAMYDVELAREVYKIVVE